MAYQAGDNILTTHYNTFLNGTSAGNYGINHIIGTGTGNLGLGQTTLVRNDDQVKTGDIVTAAQWNSLFTAMDNLANHTNDTLAVSTRPRGAGEIIAVVSSLNSDLQTLATSVQGGCVNTTALTTGTATSNTTSAVWDSFHQATYSFTFTGGDQARWFFNAGGKLRITFSNTATNATGLDAVVTQQMNNITAFDIGATVSGVTGGDLKDDSALGDSTRPESAAGAAGAGVDGRTLGYYDLTTEYKTLLDYYEASGTYDYSYQGLVSINIMAKVNAPHGDGRGNNGNVVTVKVRIENTDPGYTKAGNFTVIAGKVDYDGKYAKIKENSCGPTTISFNTRGPNTTEGLSTSISSPTIAKVEAFAGEDAYVRGGTPGTITITNL